MSPEELYAYDAWPSRYGQGWGEQDHHGPYDDVDFHVDLGCGRLPKARIGVDRYAAPGVAVVMDLDERHLGSSSALAFIAQPNAPGQDASSLMRAEEAFLPFADSSIESIVSHHFFEHVQHLIPLMEECYRVLRPGGLLRAITPLWPSWAAMSDPDHRRHFLAAANEHGEVSTSWDTFCGTPGDEGSWLNSFSVPYTTARFERVDADYTPPVDPAIQWTPQDARELRVALIAMK